MFGERYDNNGDNEEFRPASPTAATHHGSGNKGKTAAASTGRFPKTALRGALPPVTAGRNLLHGGSRDEDGEEGHRPDAGPRVKTVAEIVEQLDEDNYVRGPKGGCCARMFIPFLTALLLLVTLIATIWTSGTGVDVAAAPRVALFVIEGLRGDIFHEMMQHEWHLPNIAAVVGAGAQTGLRGGVYAACPTPGSATCARAVMVEDDTTGFISVSSGSGLASILSGVSPRLHRVRADTLADYAAYATTSNTYPSLAKRVTDAGKTVAVMATSHLLNSFNPSSGRCTEAGVLDMECAESTETILSQVVDPVNPGATSLECLPVTTCNAQKRRIKTPTNPDELSDGHAETQYTRQLRALFGALEYRKPGQQSAIQSTVADNLADSLFVFHFDELAKRAGSAALPEFSYDSTSATYAAQAYLIDALIGQVLSFIKDRTKAHKENWLILGVADHGGSGKSYAGATTPGAATTSTTRLNANQVIGFFMATSTANSRGHVRLSPLGTATSQLDVLPTVLRWLDVAPYDEETQAAAEGRNESFSAAVEERLRAREVFEGQIRGICTSGLSPADCV